MFSPLLRTLQCMHDSRYCYHLACSCRGFLLASHDIPSILLLTSLADASRPLKDSFSTQFVVPSIYPIFELWKYCIAWHIWYGRFILDLEYMIPGILNQAEYSYCEPFVGIVSRSCPRFYCLLNQKYCLECLSILGTPDRRESR